jgi:hypothetical protein
MAENRDLYRYLRLAVVRQRFCIRQNYDRIEQCRQQLWERRDRLHGPRFSIASAGRPRLRACYPWQTEYRGWQIVVTSGLRGYVAALFGPAGQQFDEPVLCFSTAVDAMKSACACVDWMLNRENQLVSS